MNGNAFIKMQKEDLVTYNGGKPLAEVVEAMAAVIAEHPTADIDAKKTAEELYDAMEKEAREKRIRCFAGEPLKKFITDYLGIQEEPVAPQKSGGYVNLEDFF